jgi:hypothetical protein
MNPDFRSGSVGWAERLGTVAVFAWWLLIVGGVLL